MTLPAALGLETAIAAWAAACTGIAASRVWWDGQNQPVPSKAGGPWLSLQILSAVGVGQDWTDYAANPLVLADDVVEAVATATDSLTLTGHAMQTGDGPVRVTTTGTLPGGLAAGVDYWAIRVDANTVKLASSHKRALDGVAVDLTSAGTGTHTISGTADTVRTGLEVLHMQRGARTVVVSIQCHGAPAVGDDRAAAVLERLRSRNRLPTPRAALEAATLAVAELGSVQALGGALNQARFEGRAVVQVTFHGVSEASEASSRIDFAQTVNETTGAELWVPTNPNAP